MRGRGVSWSCSVPHQRLLFGPLLFFKNLDIKPRAQDK
jgi:hypothetical protein